MASLSTAGPRVQIVKVRGLAGQLRVYETADAFEFDRFTQGELTRRRVFYDDVLLVTLHRSLGWPFLATHALLATLGAVPSVSLGREDPRSGLILFAFLGLPFLLALALRLVFRNHRLTLYGKRSRVRVAFGMRRGRAREVFGRICRRVREEQERR